MFEIVRLAGWIGLPDSSILFFCAKAEVGVGPRIGGNHHTLFFCLKWSFNNSCLKVLKRVRRTNQDPKANGVYKNTGPRKWVPSGSLCASKRAKQDMDLGSEKEKVGAF